MRLGYLLVATSVNSMPFINGMEISTKAISGFMSSITFIASIPLAASPTTSILRLSQLIDALISFLADSSSSISITLYIPLLLVKRPIKQLSLRQLYYLQLSVCSWFPSLWLQAQYKFYLGVFSDLTSYPYDIILITITSDTLYCPPKSKAFVKFLCALILFS